MTASEFATKAEDAFRFLEGLSFVSSWNGGYSVRFDSPRVFVVVSYDATRSYEVEVEIGLQARISQTVERPFTMSEMLRALGHSDLGEKTALIQARSDEVGCKLAQLARLLREHGSLFLEGDLDLFELMGVQRDADYSAHALRTQMANATRDAGIAWKEGDYNEVVRQLEPVAELLSPSEKKRLEIARKRRRSN